MRVLLVDDHSLVRQALSSMLAAEGDIEIVGEAGDGQVAVERTRELRPDVVLMDLTMPVMNGVQATRAIHAAHPDVCVIGLSRCAHDEQAKAMRDAGAMESVTESAAPEELLTVLRGCYTRLREGWPPAGTDAPFLAAGMRSGSLQEVGHVEDDVPPLRLDLERSIQPNGGRNRGATASARPDRAYGDAEGSRKL